MLKFRNLLLVFYMLLSFLFMFNFTNLGKEFPVFHSHSLKLEIPENSNFEEMIPSENATPSRDSNFHFEQGVSLIYGRLKLTNTSNTKVKNIVCKLKTIETLNYLGQSTQIIEPNLRLSWNYEWDPDPTQIFHTGLGYDLPSKDSEYIDIFFTFNDCQGRKGVYLRVQSVNRTDNQLLDLNNSYILNLLLSADGVKTKNFRLRIDFAESHVPKNISFLE